MSASFRMPVLLLAALVTSATPMFRTPEALPVQRLIQNLAGCRIESDLLNVLLDHMRNEGDPESVTGYAQELTIPTDTGGHRLWGPKRLP